VNIPLSIIFGGVSERRATASLCPVSVYPSRVIW
jgi:hypothetical protein